MGLTVTAPGAVAPLTLTGASDLTELLIKMAPGQTFQPLKIVDSGNVQVAAVGRLGDWTGNDITVNVLRTQGALGLATISGAAIATRSLAPGDTATAGLVPIWGVTGVPAAGLGANGDIALRSDGGALTTVYQKRAGVWTGIV